MWNGPLTSCLRSGSLEAMTEMKISIQLTYQRCSLQWNLKKAGNRLRQRDNLVKTRVQMKLYLSLTSLEDVEPTWYHEVFGPWSKQAGPLYPHCIRQSLFVGHPNTWDKLRTIFLRRVQLWVVSHQPSWRLDDGWRHSMDKGIGR